MSRHVLLVNPNRVKPPIAPLALDYLAEALQAAGLPWAVCDLCFSDTPAETLQQVLLADGPLLVAVSLRNTDDCYCATQHSFIPDLQQLVTAIRRHSDAPIVLGGSGYSVAPEGVLHRAAADFGIVGDGERPLVELAKTLLDGAEVSSIPGLVWRDGEEVRATPPAWLPAPAEPLARRALDNERYFREGGQLGIETKRGCPFGCIYCADPLGKGSAIRPRPPRAVASEMMALASRGLDCFHTCDSEFNNDPDHAEAVCRALIESRAADALSWYAYCSPVPFSAELADLMRRAGCVGVNFGTDSADPGMLRRLGRGYCPDDISLAADACRHHGIAVMLDLLIGAPGETRESVRSTIEFMKQTGADCFGVALGVRIYAGTPLARELGAPSAASGVRGQVDNNDDLAMPLFYVEPGLGDDPVGLLKALIAGDQRFFFGWPDETQADYNYDDNPELVQAIRDGHRGAYWDILRKVRGL
jgi:hypothetical protein